MDTSVRPRRLFLRSGLALTAVMARAQITTLPGDAQQPGAPGVKLRSGVLKADYEQNVKDSHILADLAKSIELDLEKNGQNVLSLDLLKKLDEVDKITKRIRGRVRE